MRSYTVLFTKAKPSAEQRLRRCHISLSTRLTHTVSAIVSIQGQGECAADETALPGGADAGQ